MVPDRHSRKRESSGGMTKQPAVYILASKRNGTLYVGVTSDLERCAWQHKNELVEAFKQKYGVHHLVYYEIHEDMMSAINQEKQIKNLNRLWKLELTERQIQLGRICRKKLFRMMKTRFPLSRE